MIAVTNARTAGRHPAPEDARRATFRPIANRAVDRAMPYRIALVASVVVGTDPHCALPVAVEAASKPVHSPVWLRSTGLADPRGDIHVRRALGVSASGATGR